MLWIVLALTVTLSAQLSSSDRAALVLQRRVCRLRLLAPHGMVGPRQTSALLSCGASNRETASRRCNIRRLMQILPGAVPGGAGNPATQPPSAVLRTDSRGYGNNRHQASVCYRVCPVSLNQCVPY